MTFKELKRLYKIKDKDLAQMFGYKNAMSYYNAKGGKTKLEAGLLAFYERISLDYSHISNVVISGKVEGTHPFYPGAYISSADYKGEPMDKDQIKRLSEEFLQKSIYNSIV